MDPNAVDATYGFHSGGIIGTLEQLLNDFRSAKSDASTQELERQHVSTSQLQERLNLCILD